VADEAFLSQVKRLFVGAPIPSHLAHRERFSKVTGLAVLSSDALSSVAYATEEVLRVLAIGGVAALGLVTPIGGVIAAMLAIIVFSYRQTIAAYPNGGGAYIVAKDNLGRLPSLIAAAALLIDYVLTVAVSIAAGVAAITSAIPAWHLNTVEVSLAFVAILMLGNLRGVRESGRLFAVPTYFFIVSILAMLAVGAWRYATGTLEAVPLPASPVPLGSGGLTALGTFTILRAFSNGCTAMTGVEAVSNGVPAFRPPESRNAASTLVTMAVMSIVMFMGITLLAHAYGVIPSETETVISQVARGTFGGRSVFYYAVQAATMLILVLAANTAYADFPRLASIVARDRFLPRQFMNQGDRLAFSNGIIILSVLAALLLVVFGGDTHSLIPLYMIGVFVSFTLSQAGMVIHWRRLRTAGWRSSAVINGFGAIVTGVVLVIVAVTKATEGAWIVLVMTPMLVIIFEVTRRHYDQVAAELNLRDWQPEAAGHHTVLIPIGGIQRAVVKALQYGRTLSPDVRAVYVDIDPTSTEMIRQQWHLWGQGVNLVVLPSPYRSLMEPLLEYIEDVQREAPTGYVTVILPEFVPRRLWHHLLHNQHALLIKGALLFKPNVVVTSVPFHLGRIAATIACAAFLLLPTSAAAQAAPQPAKKPDPFTFADFSWQSGSSRTKDSPLKMGPFTGEFRADTSFTYSFNRPTDDTIGGSSEVFRHAEIQLTQLGIGGDLSHENVRARFMTQLGMYSSTTPRSDASPSRGQWSLDNAYRYISEAYGGYHWDKLNGINVDAGVFMSYIGLWSYYQFDNWTYQPSFVSSNTPWYFNGLRIQIFPSEKLKIEPWIVNGWQSYGRFTNAPGVGGQVRYTPNGNVIIIANNYFGKDTLGNPDRKRFHTDDSIQVKYYDQPGKTISKAAFTFTVDAGCEFGGGVTCHGGDAGTPSQFFLGFMAYHRAWFDHDKCALTIGGGAIKNPGRYLVLMPPINGATAFSGTPYFTVNGGDQFTAWDTQATFDYLPRQFVTFRGEFNYRRASVPYFSGPGGVTPPGGNTGAPGSLVSDWVPDLRKSEKRLTVALLVKF